MSKTTTPPALSDLWGHSIKLCNYPKLSYSQALTLWIAPEQGEPVTIQDSSERQFQALIEHALSAYPCRKKADKERVHACREELLNVECDALGKWFSLDVLLSHGITLALFKTAEEAADYQKTGGSEEVDDEERDSGNCYQH